MNTPQAPGWSPQPPTSVPPTAFPNPVQPVQNYGSWSALPGMNTPQPGRDMNPPAYNPGIPTPNLTGGGSRNWGHTSYNRPAPMSGFGGSNPMLGSYQGQSAPNYNRRSWGSGWSG